MDKSAMNQLWSGRLRAMRAPRRQLVWAARVALALASDMRLGQMNLHAMSMVYSTLLSLVPMLALSFAVLKGFGVHNELEPLLRELLLPFGDRATDITSQIISFVSNIEVGVLGAVGLGVLVYTVLSLIQKIVAAINYVWGGHGAPAAGRFLDYLAILMIGPLVLFAVLGALSGAVASSTVQALLQNAYLAQLYEQLVRWLPLLMITVALSFVYWLLPHDRVRWYAAVIGGVAAGLMWKLSGWIFASFVVGSGNYTAIYSAFASVLLFMIWLYLNWLILLVGARIAYYVQYPEMMRPDASEALSVADTERAALSVVALIALAFRAGEQPPALDALRLQLDLPGAAMEPVLLKLVDAGFLRRDEQGGYLPSMPLSQIRVLELLQVVREEAAGRIAMAMPADWFMRQVRHSLEKDWANFSVDDLLSDALKGDS